MRDDQGNLVTVELSDVAEAIIEAIEFDAQLDESAGGSGVWPTESGRVTPVEENFGVPDGQAYTLIDRAGNLYRLTIEAVAE